METKQCVFKDNDGVIFGGILIDNEYVICGCCGGVFEANEVEIIEIFKDWISISDEIIGE